MVPPYLLLLLSDASGRCQVCDPVENYRVVFSAESYEQAKFWLLEDEYESVQGRVWMSELQGEAMNHSTNVSAVNGSISIGGNVTASTLNTGHISGDIHNAVTHLKQSEAPSATELSDLLAQLQAVLEAANPTLLTPEDKALALEQVKELAIASQKPDLEKQTVGRRALTFLRGTVAAIPTALPAAATLVEGVNQLLPAIAHLLGL
jgi:hypothetical protein